MTAKKTTLLMCIGAQKAGTTWLGKQLQNHPNVYTPPIKEIHHFDSIHRKVNHKVRNKRIRMYKKHVAKMAFLKFSNPNYIQTTKWLLNYCVTPKNDDEWYLSLFDIPGNIINNKSVFVDNTPEYSIIDKKGLQHIKNIHPNVKIIFLMREPKSRVWSAIRYFSKNNPEKTLLEDNEKMINFINERGTEKRNDYISIMKNIESVFSKENILYQFYENIFDSEMSQLLFLEQICNFIKVEYDQSFFIDTISERVNATASQNIPDKIDKYLQLKYRKQNKTMKEIFQKKLPNSWT